MPTLDLSADQVTELLDLVLDAIESIDDEIAAIDARFPPDEPEDNDLDLAAMQQRKRELAETKQALTCALQTQDT